MIGRRVMPDAEGWLPPNLQPGEYGHASEERAKLEDWPRLAWWQICCPDGSVGTLNPNVHTITEHEDGTITVSPSIVSVSWHGWLKQGVWSVA